jgi:hypothetical protein
MREIDSKQEMENDGKMEDISLVLTGIGGLHLGSFATLPWLTSR